MEKAKPHIRIECDGPNLRQSKVFLKREDGSEIDLAGCVVGFKIETNREDGWCVVELTCLASFDITGEGKINFGLLVKPTQGQS